MIKIEYDEREVDYDMYGINDELFSHSLQFNGVKMQIRDNI